MLGEKGWGRNPKKKNIDPGLDPISISNKIICQNSKVGQIMLFHHKEIIEPGNLWNPMDTTPLISAQVITPASMPATPDKRNDMDKIVIESLPDEEGKGDNGFFRSVCRKLLF